MFSNLLRRSFWRYLLTHPWLGVLSILGVAIGVAVVVAMDLASESAKRSFSLSTEALVGSTTHRIRADAEGLNEDLYARLRREKPSIPASPIVDGYVTLLLDRPVTLRLLGIDPLSDTQTCSGTLWAEGSLEGLMGSPDQVVLTRQTAQQLGLSLDRPVEARVGQRPVALRIAGVLESEDERTRVGLANLMLADLSTAQHLLQQKGRLSAIDVVLDDPTELERWLPPGVSLEPASQGRQTLEQMTEAFHLNLKALSLLSLLVAMFLIYNVTAFSVVHRRAAMARLRALGVLPEELFSTVMTEVATTSLMGSWLGLALGVILGRELVVLVTRTLNDLYYVMELTNFSLSPAVLVKGVCLGMLAALGAALGPAREAAHTIPALLVHRSRLEDRTRKLSRLAAALGAVAILIGLALVKLPGLWAGLISMMAILVGSALVAPELALFLLWLLPTQSLPLRARLAIRSIPAGLSRTGTALSALMIAVAASVSIGLMVHSFRTTLVDWLEMTLQADVYVALTDRGAMWNQQRLPQALVEELVSLPGVVDYTSQSLAVVASSTGESQLIVTRAGGNYSDSLKFREAKPQVWEAFERGELLVCEPYAERDKLQVGQDLELLTPAGWKRFPIAGIFYSYGPERGLTLINQTVYRQHWKGKPGASGLGLYLDDPKRAEEVALQAASLIEGEGIEVRSTASLKALSIEIFEQTFLVTGVLRLLALGVAFVGILGSLTVLGLEKVREYSTLRALGLTRRELAGLVTTQSTCLGLLAGLLALPVGVALAALMVLVINKRAFGWTLFFSLEPSVLFQALALSVAAALLAGFVPAWLVGRLRVSEGLRVE